MTVVWMMNKNPCGGCGAPLRMINRTTGPVVFCCNRDCDLDYEVQSACDFGPDRFGYRLVYSRSKDLMIDRPFETWSPHSQSAHHPKEFASGEREK